MIEVETSVDDHDKMHESADKAFLLAKVREFMLDEFRAYLNVFAESSEANPTNLEIVDDNNVGFDADFMNVDDHDPQYKVFLDSVREIGNSPMIEYDAGDGIKQCIEFEGDDGTDDRRKPTLNRKSKNRGARKSKIQGIPCASKRLRTENGRQDCIPKARATKGLYTSKTSRGFQPNGEDVVRRLRQPKVVKKNIELTAEEFVSCQRNSSSYRRSSPEVFSSPRKFNSDRQLSPEVLNPAAHEYNTEDNCEKFDECYRWYLRFLLDSEENSRINSEKSVLVNREPDTMSVPDSDILEVSDHPFSDGEDTPFVPNKTPHVFVVEEENCGPVQIYNSSLKKELMDILRKPYDEKEFLELYSEVSIHKPIWRDRQLRDGREISYKTDILADSYLDRHPDFKKIFRSCRDDPSRALNLLRGFFFYLKHVVHKDMFKPWLDSECLKTMPQVQEKLCSVSGPTNSNINKSQR